MCSVPLSTDGGLWIDPQTPRILDLDYAFSLRRILGDGGTANQVDAVGFNRRNHRFLVHLDTTAGNLP